jgi:hypothetical protein
MQRTNQKGFSMLTDQPVLSDISQAISDAMAPAFILAAIAGLISAMMARAYRIQDRLQALSDTDGCRREHEPINTAYLEARAFAVNICVFLLLCCAVCIVLFVMLVFVSIILKLHHERLILNVFVLALLLLFVSLTLYAREVWIVRRKPY